ncbi:flavin reductase (DIM6/NTAB) family NADH-FMN oxidoreductase RutF [Nonomuraea polychroma]|uniref:Flavin reductase (DIM6/NTAB) family NADH-FMN oxidoreductase RutF n=1 Tax=Nonomuraea polychroma TaxID=46176 RepID=A0A438MEL1_9ACTN|nr:flavin reductase family protein [Nonomuraea polychroma]RVX44157.1 flavin reductase (DIM6/NTAB) family NADH-FMN oxidoreductase RutF [Nonomuraea polychroma]
MIDSSAQSAVRAGSTVTPAEFRSLMAGFPTGVAILTTFGPDGEARGMTCSSVCSVTLTPPVLLVCVRCGSPTLEAITQRGAFAVNLLHEGAADTAGLFASGDPDRFDRIHWQAGSEAAGPHLVDDAHAVAHCRVAGTQTVGDHVIVLGEAYLIRQATQPEPLLYGLRRYAAWPATVSAER